MPHEILRTAQVATVLGGMSAREKRSYEAAVDALRGEGCGAGGYRLAAADGDDYARQSRPAARTPPIRRR